MALAHKFRIGSILSDTFGVIRRNLILCVGLTLIIYALPLTLWEWKSTAWLASDDGEQPIAIMVIGLVGDVMLGASLQAALTRATIEDLRGKRPSFRDCVKTALAVLLPSVAISLLVALGAWIGLLFLIVPGLFLMARWSVVIPVLVQERLGVFAAMRRSRDLAKGSLWPLMGVWLLMFVAFIALDLVPDGFAFLSDTKLVPFLNTLGVTKPGLFFDTLAGTAIGLVQSIAPAAMYIELLRVKEGASVDELAEIFS
jgi:hypothetical protein